MSKYNTSSLINILRERIGLERAAMIEFSKLDDSSLRKIEKEKQHPKPDTLDLIIKSIDLPLDTFVYSPLEGQPMEVYLLCDELTQWLDLENPSSAEPILNQLEALPGFNEGVLLQFILSKKARLRELQDKPVKDIFPLIDKAINETFENFDETKITSKIFVLEEPELIHTKARLYAKSGDIKRAINILDQLVISMQKLPAADREKEKKFAPVLLTLANCLLLTKEYKRVLEISNSGSDYSAVRNYGRYNPDFEFIKAKALFGLDKPEECRTPLQHAYFGYMLLGEKDKANEVLHHANEKYNIFFELYGADELDFSNQKKEPYNRGEPVECNSIGTMIGALRKKAGLSLEKLCQGICNKTTLMRIENNEINASFFILEALTQRLGRDINLYSNFFLSKSDFTAIQLRDRIYINLINHKYSEAEALLEEIEQINSFIKYPSNRQFIETAKADLLYSYNKITPENHSVTLIKIMKKTYPKFEISNLNKYVLTNNEIFLLNNNASALRAADKFIKSVECYNHLRRYINNKYDDEFQKALVLGVVLFNYSSVLGKTEKRIEALSVISEAELFDRNLKHLDNLPGLIYNMGYNLMKLNRNEHVLSYFALAYYVAHLFINYGKSEYLPIIQNTVNVNFGFLFD